MTSRPLLSVCELSTPHLTFEQDARLYSACGLDGIGIFEGKLADADDAAALDLLHELELCASICIPTIASILPDELSRFPADPLERCARIEASVRRLALFAPATILVTSGDPERAGSGGQPQEILERALAHLSGVAAEVGTTIGFEPLSSGAVVTDFGAALEMMGRIDSHGHLQMIFDAWHMWRSTNRDQLLREHSGRISGVHVADWRDPTRGWCDRAVPGAGIIDLDVIARALKDGGYTGWYDVEIFSDDGTFGSAYPDSLWQIAPEELVIACRRGLHDMLGADEEPAHPAHIPPARISRPE